MLLRLVDLLKSRGITALLVHLTAGGAEAERTDVDISSLIDTWILLRNIELGGERNRGLYILKSRGMKHSNQIREFLITSRGVRLEDVYVGPEGVLTGSMRLAQEAREQVADRDRRLALRRRQHDLRLRRERLEAQIAALRAECEAASAEEAMAVSEAAEFAAAGAAARRAAAQRRGGAGG
jgi:circadian clock protein KaiC